MPNQAKRNGWIVGIVGILLLIICLIFGAHWSLWVIAINLITGGFLASNQTNKWLWSLQGFALVTIAANLLKHHYLIEPSFCVGFAGLGLLLGMPLLATKELLARKGGK